MQTLILSERDIRSNEDLPELREAMHKCLASLSLGHALNGARSVISLRRGMDVGFMPAAVPGALGYKLVAVCEGNASRGLNPHQGLVALLEGETGRPLCLMNASAVTALRTAAVSAAASDALALRSARVLGLVGAGLQAYEHARALGAIRDLREVHVWSRDPTHATKLAERLAAELGLAAQVASAPDHVAREADILVTCTPSRYPLLSTDGLKPGAHVNAVGSSRPGFRELALHARPELRVFVDSRAACEAESDELRVTDEGWNPTPVAGEIGAVFSGTLAGRADERQVTVFKSVGLSVEDVATGELLFRRAVKLKVGQFVEL